MKKILFALLFSVFVSGIIFGEVPETFEKGIDLVNNWKFDEAISVFEKFIKENPDSKFKPMALKWIAGCYFEKKDYTKSMEYNNKFILEYPNHPDSVWSKIAIFRTYMHYLGNSEKAMPYLDEIINKHSNTPAVGEAYLWKGYILRAENEEYEKSAKVLAEFIKKFPDAIESNRARYYLADNYLRLKEYKKSIEQYEAVSKSTNKKEAENASYYIGWIQYYNLSDLVKAQQSLEDFVKKYPDSKRVKRANEIIERCKNKQQNDKVFKSLDKKKEQEIKETEQTILLDEDANTEKINWFTTASKKELLDKLQIVKMEDKQSIQKILWQLSKRYKLTTTEEKQILPYLNHPDSDIFSAAVESLKNSKNEETISKLKSKIYENNAFRARRAAEALYEVQKDTSAYNYLKETLISENRNSSFRRRLVRNFILYVRDKDVIDVYINLLSDSNTWIRYNAINILKKETGNMFNYRYREDIQSNKNSIDKWKDWWQKEKGNFQFNSTFFEPLAGIGVAIDIDEEGNHIFIKKIFPNLGADKSGLKRGNIILEVDGDSTKDKLPQEVAQYEVLGNEGTFVNLTIKDRETGKIKEVKIKREILKFNK